MAENSERKSNLAPSPRFNGKHLIRDVLIIDAVFYLVTLIQYIFVPLSVGALMYDYIFYSTIILILIGLNIVGVIYYKLLPVAMLLNTLLLLIGSAVFTYTAIMFNGPFNIAIIIIEIVMALLNWTAFTINIRGHWKNKMGTLFVTGFFGILVIGYTILLQPNAIDVLVSILIFTLIGFFVESFIVEAKKHRFNPLKMMDTSFFQGGELKKHTIKKLSILALIIISLGGLVVGSANNWNSSITIKAPDDFQTISSYWGPPSLTLESHNTTISVTDLDRINIWNSTMDNDPELFRNGSLAYIINITEGGNSKNYCNYSTGAQSYPNGTIILSESLPGGHGPVNVTMKYVYNHQILEYLNISGSTLIMNFRGDFIYNDNIFESIEKVYLLQLLDYWEIKFYLDIHNPYSFPNVFNYLDSIPIGRTTLNWADGKWDMFMGISFDFETGSLVIPEGHPGAVNLSIGDAFSGPDFWEDIRKSWYDSNEQNDTLIEEAISAYEKLYDEASALGYKTYITTGRSDLRDTWDGDIDYTRCPLDPLNSNEDVIFGVMNYESSNHLQGRYRVYKGCYNQIAQLGERGNTILLGWLAQGENYYTDDDLGLQRYIQDCKIAQATGMVEIFHAPIYRMQRKWGDDAVIQLHEALNEDEKESITINVPIMEADDETLYDVILNFNYMWLFIPFSVFIIVEIGFFGAGNLYQVIRLAAAKKNKRIDKSR